MYSSVRDLLFTRDVKLIDRFQVIAALSGIIAILSIPFMDETYAPVLRMRYDIASGDPERARTARRHLGPDLQLGRWKFIWVNLARPILLLTCSFICFVLSLYMALIYGIYYLMFATFTGICYLTPRHLLFLTEIFTRALHPYLRFRHRNLRSRLSRARGRLHYFRCVCRTVLG
jgi:hypothetical protein